jgi:hypothetical protein
MVFPSFTAADDLALRSGGVSKPPITYVNVSSGAQNPEANVGNVEWNQRFGRRTLLNSRSCSAAAPMSSLNPDARPACCLGSTGVSGIGIRSDDEINGGDARPHGLGRVGKGTADLNNYDRFGNLRTIVRPNRTTSFPPTSATVSS